MSTIRLLFGFCVCHGLVEKVGMSEISEKHSAQSFHNVVNKPSGVFWHLGFTYLLLSILHCPWYDIDKVEHGMTFGDFVTRVDSVVESDRFEWLCTTKQTVLQILPLTFLRGIYKCGLGFKSH